MLFRSLFILHILFANTVAGGSGHDETRLIEALLYTGGYSRLVRPVVGVKTLNVSLGLSITTLDLDAEKNVLHIQGWMEHNWQDEFLKWDPEEFGGIRSVYIPYDNLWHPDITAFNLLDVKDAQATLVNVNHDGRLHYTRRPHLQTKCNLDLRAFPLDEQQCSIRFGSWAYNGFQVNVLARSSMINLDSYEMNNEWELVNTSIQRDVLYYPCCPEPYPTITAMVHVRRRHANYKLTYGFPAVLALLTPFIFLLTPADSQKCTLGIGILICYTVFFQHLLTVNHSSHINYMDLSFLIQYVLISLSIAMATIVANVAGGRRKPPALLYKVFRSCLGRCLCVSAGDTDLSSSEPGQSKADLYTPNSGRSQWLLVATVIDRLFFLLSLLTVSSVVPIMFTIICLQ